MSEQLTTVIFDGFTREQSVRPLSEEELASLELVKQEENAAAAEALSKASARQSALDKLATLGLTEDEIAAL
jgi:BMFP domain-containing protein YqiC